MAANETDHQNKPVRPSWETAAPSARPAAPRPVASQPVASPAYSPPPAAYTPPASPEPFYSAPVYSVLSDAAPLSDPDMQYDLAGNPIVRSAPPSNPVPQYSTPYAPPAPFGYSAGPATAAPGVWPPPVAGGPQAYRNNSGEQSHLPPELERLRWHWGAFFFPILWTKKHGLTTVAAMLTGGLLFMRLLKMVFAVINPLAFLAVYIFYGVAYFGLQLYLGLNGHKIGWRNRHFSGGLEEYFKVQNAWMWWGFGINITLGIVLPVLLALGVIGAVLSSSHSRSSYGSGSYGSGSYGSSSYSSPANSPDNSSSSGQ